MTGVRRRSLIVLLFMSGLFVVPAAASATPRASAPRVDLHEYFSTEDFQRAQRYRAPRYALGFISLGAELIALLVIGLAGGTRRFGNLASKIAGDRWWLQAIVLAVAITVVLTLVDLPFGLGRFALDRAWGLSTQNLGGYFSDEFRSLGFQLVFTIVVALPFFWVARAAPRTWPIWAALGAVVLTFVFSMLFPVVYEPLFNKFTPVEPALKDRIVALGKQEGVRVGSVLVADASKRTTTQNAYVSGLGATKRVVLYDTLLQKSTEKEVELVVAHELAHVAHNDVTKGTAFGALGAALGVGLIWLLLAHTSIPSRLGVEGAGDPRILGFLLLVVTVAGLLATPIENAYSRKIEGAADRTAVQVTRDWRTSIAVEVNLARDSISDLEPNGFIRWAFFSHPSTAERIGIALEERDLLGEK